MARPRTLSLTRDQLHRFIGDDFETIKQFERLFAVGDTTPDELAVVQALADALALAPVQSPLPNAVADYLEFRRFAPFVPMAGRMGWNPAYDTLQLGMLQNVVQRVGFETYAQVQNASGAVLPAGAFVRFTGITAGNILDVAPFTADGTQSPLATVGVISKAIGIGAQGYATVYGTVAGIDTSAFASGDILYASATVPGGYVTTPPAALAVPVAVVLLVSASERQPYQPPRRPHRPPARCRYRHRSCP